MTLPIPSYAYKASERSLVDRIPTGVFPIDFYLDGGLAKKQIALLWGPYSGGKTTLALKATAQAQAMYPDRVGLWIDAENAFDYSKAIDHGVDLDRLVIAHPPTGGAASDLICEWITTDSKAIAIIVVDSLNALLNKKELDKSVDDTTIALNAAVVSMMMKRVNHELNMKFDTGDVPPVLMIGQARANMGYGYAEYKNTAAFASKHFVSTMLKCTASKAEESKTSDELSLLNLKVSFEKVRQSSFPVPVVEYDMVVGRDHILYGEEKALTGFVDDFAFVIKQAKEYGLHGGSSTKQKLLTPELDQLVFGKLDEMKEFFYQNPAQYAKFKWRLIEARRAGKLIITKGVTPYLEHIWSEDYVETPRDTEEQQEES